MISTTWTKAPADLLGLGSLDMSAAHAPVMGAGSAVRPAAPFAGAAQVGGTGLPVGSVAVRLRPVTRRPIGHDAVTTKSFENNGTTLGIHSSGRPQS
jgi:hypothetical protein